MEWNIFSKSERAAFPVDFEDTEWYYVKLPCSTDVHFKLFLYTDEGQSSHVEMEDKTQGNIYCHDAGTKSWWGGEKTDFYMEQEMSCENSSIILV